MKNLLLALLLALPAASWAQAILPPSCPPGIPQTGADLCSDVCFFCPMYNALIGNTEGYTSQTPAGGFCGSIENEQWFVFVAGTNNITITGYSLNCQNGDGIQLSLYQGCDGLNLACNVGGQGTAGQPISISSPVVQGQTYYLLIDGWAGDICEFRVYFDPENATQSPTLGATGAISGPLAVCSGETIEYSIPVIGGAASYLWTAPAGSLINGEPSPHTIDGPSGASVDITLSSISGPLCVQPISGCDTANINCISVQISNTPVNLLPPVVRCAEDVPYFLPWGPPVTVSGNYQQVLPAANGCDSITRQNVTVLQHNITVLPPMSICAGECVTINNVQYCEPGNFYYTLPAANGCDSIINFTLVPTGPVAGILGPPTLTCVEFPHTFYSAPSVGDKVWTNAAGQTLSTGDSLTVQQPGIYTLTVSATVGATPCQSNAQVVILAAGAPPFVTATINATTSAFAQNGSITLHPNGTGYTYLWSTGSTAASIGPVLAGDYCVTVVDGATNCDAVYCYSVPIVNPVSALASPSLRLFPNPAAAGSALEAELPVEWSDSEVQLELFDATGRLLLQRTAMLTAGRLRFNLPELPAGAVLVRLRGARFVASEVLLVH